MKQEFSLYEPYGLNKYRNFLSSPLSNVYGFGLKKMLQLESEQDVFDFASMALAEHDCPESAVFTINCKGEMAIVMYFPNQDEEEPFAIMKARQSYMDFFAECDAEFRFCCYALLVEREKGSWEIIE